MPPPAALPDLGFGQVFLQNGQKSAWICNEGNAPAVGAQFFVDGEPSDTYRANVPPGDSSSSQREVVVDDCTHHPVGRP